MSPQSPRRKLDPCPGTQSSKVEIPDGRSLEAGENHDAGQTAGQKEVRCTCR